MSGQTGIWDKLHTKHIVLPSLLGLAGVAYLFWKEFRNLSDLAVDFTWTSIFFIVSAYLVVLLRDASGMLRLYQLADRKLRFSALFRIRMLYEFTSAITPSVAGGSTLEVLFIHKEGVTVSKSTAITIVELFLDEAFFIVVAPLLFLFVPIQDLFFFDRFGVSVLTIFVVVYLIKFVWVALLFWTIFINPQFIARIVSWVFKLKFLRKWKFRAMKTAVEIKTCSLEMRHQSFAYWFKAAMYSFVLWSARFVIVNLLILAFNPVSEHLLIYGRQLVSFVTMQVSPTPGGSGFIEILFGNYLDTFITSSLSVVIIGLLWRLFTYYQYLAIGIALIPTWLKSKKQ